MAFPSDHPHALRAYADPSLDTLAEVVNTVGQKLSAAVAHTSRAAELESRRRTEQVLGRKLVPLFALELVTHLLVPGEEGRELRAAFVALLNVAESPQWKESSAQPACALPGCEDEAEFLASAAAESVRLFARCGKCMADSAAEHAGEALSCEAAAENQWVLCAQCRCAISDWQRD